MADILNICLDRDGFMWIASQSHIQRFDGRHRMHFPFEQTVLQVFDDTENRKWALTRSGVSLYDEIRRQFYEVACDTFGGLAALGIFEDAKKQPILLKSNGYYRYHPQKKIFEWQRGKFSNRIKAPVNLWAHHQDKTLAGTYDSIFVIDQKGDAIASHYFRSKYSIKPVTADRVLVSATTYQCFELNLQTGNLTRLQVSTPVPGYKDRDFIVYQSIHFEGGNYLLSSNKGLLLYDTLHATVTQPVLYFGGQPFQNQSSIKALYRDRSGTVFIGHADGIFIMRLGSRGIQYLRNYRDGLTKMPENDVRSFTEDPQGHIWMATTNGMVRLNMQDGSLKVFAPFTSGNPIAFPSYRELLADGDHIWIGSSGNGVWALHTPDNRYLRPAPMPGTNDKDLTRLFNSTYIWKFVKLKSGYLLAIGGGRSFLIHPGTLLYQKVEFESSGKNSRGGIQDASGRIWHGTTRGLWCMDSAFQTLFSIRDSFPDQRVAAFTEWKKDHMLIGSKGLFEAVSAGNKILSFRRIGAIPGERFIYCMVQDEEGNVWLGTDEGIYKYDPERQMSEWYGNNAFIQSQAFNSNGAFRAKDGRIFMGGLNGVNFFYPKEVSPMHHALKPVISSFTMGGNDSLWLTAKGPIRLLYRQRDIYFTISAPEYIQPFLVQYRYRLKPDGPWNSNGYSPLVRIHNLPPGNYSLEIAAGTDGASWYRSSQIYHFSVAAPWWQSFAFRSLLVLAIGGILWGTMLYRSRKRNKAEMEKAVSYFALSGSPDAGTTDILWDIARNCISRLGFVDCVIYLLDHDRNMLIQKAAFGQKNTGGFEISNPIEIPVGKGITGYAAQTGTTQWVTDTSKDDRYIVDDASRLSELCVPILHNGKVIGLIDSEHPRRNFFTHAQKQTLEQIAAICSSKIARTLAVEAMQEAERKLSDLNHKMMEAKFMNLRLQMNPHFLFNTLTSIQYLVVSGQVNKAIRYLNVFSGFLRDLLQFAEYTVVTLEEEIRVLELYVELESLSVDETFIYTIEVDEQIEQDDVWVPFMILQPFVENAIHHGLVHRPGDKKFAITIRNVQDEQLVCTIEDNGIGRQKAGEIKARKMRAARHESKGVPIVTQRLELLREKTGKQASLAYEDLWDSNGQPDGTRVILVMPYYQNEDL